MSKNNLKFNINLGLKQTRVSLNLNQSNVLFTKPTTSLEAQDGSANVLFLDKCEKSINLDKLFFCNFLPELIKNTETDKVLKRVLGNPDILSNDLQPIYLDYNNGKRIKSIFSKIIGDELTEKYSNFIYEKRIKADVSLSQKGRVRIFSLYAVDNSKDENENYIIVFVFDPFHLVCPVRNKNKTAEEVMQDKYKDCCDNEKQFKDFYEENFSKVKTISVKELKNNN